MDTAVDVTSLVPLLCVLCALVAVRARRLIAAALWLAGTSAGLALTLYLLDAPYAAVIELSVGAGWWRCCSCWGSRRLVIRALSHAHRSRAGWLAPWCCCVLASSAGSCSRTSTSHRRATHNRWASRVGWELATPDLAGLVMHYGEPEDVLRVLVDRVATGAGAGHSA